MVSIALSTYQELLSYIHCSGALIGQLTETDICLPKSNDDAHTVNRSHHAQYLDFQSKKTTLKRGLLGFVNGSRVTALADTGATQNVISAALARKRHLLVEGPPQTFRLGNSTTTESMGKGA